MINIPCSNINCNPFEESFHLHHLIHNHLEHPIYTKQKSASTKHIFIITPNIINTPTTLQNINQFDWLLIQRRRFRSTEPSRIKGSLVITSKAILQYA